MNKKQQVLLISILFSIASLLVCGYFYYRLISIEKTLAEVKNENGFNAYIQSILKTNIISQIDSERRTFGDVSLKTIPKLNHIGLHEIINSDNKLVLYFSENSCSDCRNQELRNIREFCEKYGKDKAFVLISNEAGELSPNMDIQFTDAYLMSQSDWSLPIEPPVLFLINSGGQVSHVFKPSSDLPLLSLDYYESIGTKYFRN